MSDDFRLPPFPTEPPSTIPLDEPTSTPDTPAGQVQVLPELAFPTTPVVVQKGMYHEYAIAKVICDVSGLSVQPIAGPASPPTPADVIRERAPYGWAVVHWISRRRKAAPIIPSRDMGCANEVYLRGQITVSLPGKFADGTPCWQISGVYYYGLRVPYTEEDTITLGAFPYTNESASDYQVTPDMYSKDIIGPDETPPEGAPEDPIDF